MRRQNKTAGDCPKFAQSAEQIGTVPFSEASQTYTFETRVNIPAQWGRFTPQLGKIPGQIGNATYGVCWNYKPSCGFDDLSGVEVGDASSLPSGFSQIRMPAQRYAVFTHRKHVSSIPETLEAIWTKWLPNSRQQAAESPSFERYSEQFNPQTGMGGVEIWVPIKTRTGRLSP